MRSKQHHLHVRNLDSQPLTLSDTTQPPKLFKLLCQAAILKLRVNHVGVVLQRLIKPRSVIRTAADTITFRPTSQIALCISTPNHTRRIPDLYQSRHPGHPFLARALSG